MDERAKWTVETKHIICMCVTLNVLENVRNKSNIQTENTFELKCVHV